MSNYAEDHASAYADVLEAGSAVTWSKTTSGTYDSATDTYSTPVTTTCPGVMIEVDGDDAEYQALELIASSPVTGFFIPTTYGDLPTFDMTGTWGGVTKNVKRVRAGGLRPGGSAIGAYLVVV